MADNNNNNSKSKLVYPPRKRPRPNNDDPSEVRGEEEEKAKSSFHDTTQTASAGAVKDNSQAVTIVNTDNNHAAPEFTLVVQGDAEKAVELDISYLLAARLRASCAFFRNAFRHGTKESLNKTISKLDWNLETAKAILELIDRGRLLLGEDDHYLFPVEHQYAAFKEAVDQILVPVRMAHPVYGYNGLEQECDTVQLMADTWKASSTYFTMDVRCRQGVTHNADRQHCVWDELLKAGIVFVKHHPDHDADGRADSAESRRKRRNGLEIELLPEPQDDYTNPADPGSHLRPPLPPPRTAPPPTDILSVGSSAPLFIAVNHTCVSLSESLRDSRRHALNQMSNRPACMALPLYMGGLEYLRDQFCYDNYGKDLNILTIGTDNVPTVNMVRITAPLDDLQRVLEAATDWIAPIRLTKLCYLLLPGPPVRMLGQLITACQTCTDDPGSVGWDVEKNQYCTLKTFRDTQHIIAKLVDSKTTPLAKMGTIRLVGVDMTAAPEWSAY